MRTVAPAGSIAQIALPNSATIRSARLALTASIDWTDLRQPQQSGGLVQFFRRERWPRNTRPERQVLPELTSHISTATADDFALGALPTGRRALE